eukprot:GDKK01049620.1.p1 GENE.GDKK01049620.1~~GDKK01049620.1.p1  ORF type:complete len:195 (-),score=40.68 GDKK01049620.1:139-642(-)
MFFPDKVSSSSTTPLSNREKSLPPQSNPSFAFGKVQRDSELRLPSRATCKVLPPPRLDMSLAVPSALMVQPPPRSTRRLSTDHIANVSHDIFGTHSSAQKQSGGDQRQTDYHQSALTDRQREIEQKFTTMKTKAIEMATMNHAAVSMGRKIDRNRTSGALLSALHMK